MQIKLNGNTLTVIREATDKKYYGTGNGAGESNLLYDLKNELNKIGFNLIKKRMWKDGHLVDDMQQYLKTKDSKTNSPHIYLYNNYWAIKGLNDDFNEGECTLSIEQDIYDKQPDCYKKLLDLLCPIPA